MLCAAETVLLLLSGLLPSGRLALVVLAGALNAAALLEAGPVRAWLLWAATSLLGLLLCPLKGPAFLYLLLFGHYPILKSHLERLSGRILPWLGKLLVFFITAALLLYLYKLALLSGVSLPARSIAVLFLLGCAGFFVYDVLLSGLIEYYWNRKNKQ